MFGGDKDWPLSRAFSLAERMLHLNFKHRINAQGARVHRYFAMEEQGSLDPCTLPPMTAQEKGHHEKTYTDRKDEEKGIDREGRSRREEHHEKKSQQDTGGLDPRSFQGRSRHDTGSSMSIGRESSRGRTGGAAGQESIGNRDRDHNHEKENGGRHTDGAWEESIQVQQPSAPSAQASYPYVHPQYANPPPDVSQVAPQQYPWPPGLPFVGGLPFLTRPPPLYPPPPPPGLPPSSYGNYLGPPPLQAQHSVEMKTSPPAPGSRGSSAEQSCDMDLSPVAALKLHDTGGGEEKLDLEAGREERKQELLKLAGEKGKEEEKGAVGAQGERRERERNR